MCQSHATVLDMDIMPMALASVRLRLTPSCSTLPTTASHSAPALVLTQSPRDLMPPPRDFPMPMAMPTMALVSVRLMPMPMPRFLLLDTHMPPPMVPSPMLLLPPDSDSSTLLMLDSAPTTLELLFPAKHYQ